MGLFSGEPKIKGTERDECLAYLEEETKLIILRSKEDSLYKDAVDRQGRLAYKNSLAAREVSRAANRLVQAISEIVRRRGEIASIPNAASATFLAWDKSYLAYSKYIIAEFDVWAAEANGVNPEQKHMRELYLQSRDLQRKALKEERKLVKSLKIGSKAAQEMLDNASATVDAENWQPQQSKIV
jgi:hypothetical protein